MPTLRTTTTAPLTAFTALATLLALGACQVEAEIALEPTGQSITEARSDVPRNLNPSVPAADAEALRAGNTAFAFDLFDALAPGDANFFCSPASVSVALAMTYAGAKGDTATQMADALHFTLPSPALHLAFDELLLELEARDIALHETVDGPKSVKLAFANAAWAQKDYAFVPAYLDTLAASYGAGVKLLDFAADPAGATVAINDWVAEQTEQKILDLIPEGALGPLTRLVLTNTLYFYGSWQTTFAEELTAPATFHAPAGDVSADTMHAALSTEYAEGDGWQLADLPYDGGALVMTIVLPAAGRFAEIRDGLSADWLAQADAARTARQTALALPKFRFTWGSESLKPALQSLGMLDAFDLTKADFTGMEATGELHVSDVLHQAFVGVDESGTEAAAATAVIMSGNGGPDATLTVDRPFVFLIRDHATGAVLFVGQVTDPTNPTAS
ncbi:MAG: serpin family protein [Myxococcales bacterium]|nr:serpin family protein [Myxococcales bacterium]